MTLQISATGQGAGPRHSQRTFPVEAGLETSSDSAIAAQAFDAATYAIASHSLDTGDAIAATIAADPDHVAVDALLGFAKLMLARSELYAPATEAMARANAALQRVYGGIDDERLLVTALGVALNAGFVAASDLPDDGFFDRHAALLPFKLSHGLRFMAGDRCGMLTRSAHSVRDLPHAARRRDSSLAVKSLRWSNTANITPPRSPNAAPSP